MQVVISRLLIKAQRSGGMKERTETKEVQIKKSARNPLERGGRELMCRHQLPRVNDSSRAGVKGAKT